MEILQNGCQNRTITDIYAANTKKINMPWNIIFFFIYSKIYKLITKLLSFGPAGSKILLQYKKK
jgi:hypothetical protein